MDLIPLQGEVTFNLRESGGDAEFHFKVPKEIILEAGGLDNLRVNFEIVGSRNPYQDHVLTVTDDPDSDSFIASEILNNYHYDTVAYTLSFTDTRDEKRIGECQLDNVVLNNQAQTLACQVTLRKAAVSSGRLQASVGINVLNESGNDVSGIKVYIDDYDQIKGITGRGDFGTDGYLLVHLDAGLHTIRVVDPKTKTSAEQTLTLLPLMITNTELVLASDVPSHSRYIFIETKSINVASKRYKGVITLYGQGMPDQPLLSNQYSLYPVFSR